jgi:segregation and condensation protein B
MSTAVSPELKHIIEAALLAAGRPLSLDALQGLFGEIGGPDKSELRAALQGLAEDYRGRGIEVVEVASGWRIQVGHACSPWVSRLWDERPARYSRALMETLALIAYRQPITRGEIEDIRGVAVSSNIIKTLMEREWIRVVGQRDVPGRPSLYGTTREFLDYFGLRSLDQLPTLAELRDLEEINRELDLDGGTGRSGQEQQAAPNQEERADSEADEADPVAAGAPDVGPVHEAAAITGEERPRPAGPNET